ncbi:MAG: cyclopropane-fatty-acyl-phospholipid synthase [Herbinix sp.]|jgi:cyclopropane fatty-acyl-phospholipid synthase-like methyltransferase|nr:cyclopropane-fatty-acyl-phospholipid synthase [Herbinix sp.]
MGISPWMNKEFAKTSLDKIDTKFKPNTKEQVIYLIEKMQLISTSKILDLGCGAGRHAIEFSKRGLCVTGIDISEVMLEHAKKRATEEQVMVNYIQGNLANLSDLQLQEASYDGAICLCESGVGVMGGENKDYEFFTQVYRLLIPNSYFVLTCFNSLRRYILSKDHNPKFDYLNSTMLWAPPFEYNGEKLNELQRIYAPSEIQLLLRLCGFGDIQVLSCVNGEFSDRRMGIDDIEMLVIAKK